MDLMGICDYFLLFNAFLHQIGMYDIYMSTDL